MREIRKCKKEEVKKVGEFFDQVVYDMINNHTNYPHWVYQIYPTIDTAKDAFDKNELYLCLEQQQIVGAFILNEDPDGAYDKGHWSQDLQDGDYLVIHTLAVDKKQTGKGIGTSLVAFCIQEAKQLGYKGLRLDVVPTNSPAMKLYQKMGFHYIGDEDLQRDLADIPEFSLFEYDY